MLDIIENIESSLSDLFKSHPNNKVTTAMKYSLLSGGKRIRPLIFLTMLKSYGINYKEYMDVACAIEMIHTYSLIHDDLPCMDDDELRRGQKTCHIVFGEEVALLAGDALLNDAVLCIVNSNLKQEDKLSCIKTLYDASGSKGMIAGQFLDLENENRRIEISTLQKIHNYKTGALISACFEAASIIANKNDVSTSKNIGFLLGLAFQIQDDILDVTSSDEVLGKNTGSDLKNKKSTYVSLLGIEAAKKEETKLFEKIFEEINQLKITTNYIEEIVVKIRERVN